MRKIQPAKGPSRVLRRGTKYGRDERRKKGVPVPCLLSLLIFSFTLSFTFFHAAAHASRIPWPKAHFTRISQGEDLAMLLMDFCSSMGIKAIIDPGVKGKVNGRFKDYTPQNFFRQIVDAYGLIAYYDGQVLFLYPSSKATSRLIILQPGAEGDLIPSLKALGLYDPQFPIRITKNTGLAYVSGPPRYVELVKDTASAINQRLQASSAALKSREEIRIFPLKYAWAADHQFVLQDQEVTIPGIATTLRQILQGAPPGRGVNKGSKQLPRTLEKLKGQGLAAVGEQGGGDKGSQPPSGRESKTAKKETAGKAEGAPEANYASMVQADPRLNAVIVRDVAEKMPYYQELIRQLDTPAKLVQIEVTIIELTDDGLQELGMDWRMRAQDNTGKALSEGGYNATTAFFPGSDILGTGPGLNFATTLSLGAGQYLLGQIHALEQKGKGRFVSRPSVLTLDNIQAVIEQTQTFYARVAGSYEVDLFNVTAGVTMKVTPHVIQDEHGERIKLMVDISDGTISSDATVDSLPTVPQSSIHTQAVISEGEILALGGYLHESTARTRNAVPVLGRLPLLKWIFSSRSKETRKMERIFLIHPKIIEETPG